MSICHSSDSDSAYVTRVECVAVSSKPNEAKLKTELAKNGGKAFELHLGTSEGKFKATVPSKKLYKFLNSTLALFVPVDPPQAPQFSQPAPDCTVKRVFARQIYDSRGYPTIEVDLFTACEVCHAAIGSDIDEMAVGMPCAGKKTGYEDGIEKAVAEINSVVGEQLVGSKIPVTDQFEIDSFLARLKTERDLDARAILVLSMAACKAGAACKKVKTCQHIATLAEVPELVLPAPLFTVLNRGAKADKTGVQDFFISPVGAKTFREALHIATDVFHHLRILLEGMYGPEAVASTNDGAFAPSIDESVDALRVITEATDRSGHRPKVHIGLDVWNMYQQEGGHGGLSLMQQLGTNSSEWVTNDELGRLYAEINKEHAVTAVEEAFHCENWTNLEEWNAANQCHGPLIGDELGQQDSDRVGVTVERKACTSVILKACLSRAGTVSGAIRYAKRARQNGLSVVISALAGETEDPFIVDLSVGLATGQIKVGAPCRERIIQCNDLLRLEERLGDNARYAGMTFRNPLERTNAQK